MLKLLMSRPSVQLFILSYNRATYLKEAVSSALHQTYDNLEVIVSDNSTQDEPFKVQMQFQNIKNYSYIRRVPNLKPLEHFNKILSEVSAEYFMLFHDDDILKSEALTIMIEHLENNKNLAAIGLNATLIYDQKHTNNPFNPHIISNQTISNAIELAEHYIKPELGHMPFSSYLYRKNYAKDLILNHREGRKHADVTFLLKVAQRGPLLWLKNPLMSYRRHNDNDSNIIEIRAILSLCRFLSKQKGLDSSLLYHFKRKHLFLWYLQILKGRTTALSRHQTQILAKTGIFYVLRNPKIVFEFIYKKIVRQLSLFVRKRFS